MCSLFGHPALKIVLSKGFHKFAANSIMGDNFPESSHRTMVDCQTTAGLLYTQQRQKKKKKKE